MASKENLTVERIFILQEKCLEYVLPLVEDRFNLIKSCIEMIVNRHISVQFLTEEDKKEFYVIQTLLNDLLSSLIVSLRLALYGACVESLSLLRISLEPITVMAWKIQTRKIHEVVTFNNAKQQIRERAEIEKLYDRLSNQIIHLSSETRSFRWFKMNGVTYPRNGMAIDPDGTKLVLGELMRATLYVVRVLSVFYNTKREAVGEEYFSKVSELEERYNLLLNMSE